MKQLQTLFTGVVIVILSFACNENWSESLIEPLEASGGWTGGPVWVTSIEEMTQTSGPVSFTDKVGNQFTLLDGQFVCSADYPEMEFQGIEFHDMMSYSGLITDINDRSVYIEEGKVYYKASSSSSSVVPVPPDCAMFISEENKPCVDAQGRDGYNYCINMVFVCFNNITGLQIEHQPEICFGCGGEINGIPDTEDPDGDIGGGSICF